MFGIFSPTTSIIYDFLRRLAWYYYNAYNAYFGNTDGIENEQCKCCRIIYFRTGNLLQSTSANWSVLFVVVWRCLFWYMSKTWFSQKKTKVILDLGVFCNVLPSSFKQCIFFSVCSWFPIRVAKPRRPVACHGAPLVPRYSKTFIDASVEEVDPPLGDCSRRSCSAPPGRAEEPFLVSEEEYLNNLTEILKDLTLLWRSWTTTTKTWCILYDLWFMHTGF